MLLCSHFSTSLDLFSLLYMVKYLFPEVLYQSRIYITFIFILIVYVILVAVQLLSHVILFATWWIAQHQTSLSFTISRSLLKLMSIHSVMPSDHLILCHSLLLLSSIFPSIRVFSNELALLIRWPKYLNFSFSISPSNEYSGLISLRIRLADLISLQSKGLSRVFSNKTVQKH